MKSLNIIFLFFVVVMLSACGPAMVTKQQAFPNMYNEKPVSILVFSPINQSTAADAKDYYNTTIAEPLSMSGYYVFPIEVVNEIMKSEGYSDTEMILDVPPQKFREHFGADAVMIITIKEWNTSYYVIGGNVTVSIDYIIKSTKTGETLWTYSDTLKVNTTGQNRAGGVAGLVLQVVETAVKTAVTDYVPIALRLNYMSLSGIPAGNYSPYHGKDMNVSILKDKTENK